MKQRQAILLFTTALTIGSLFAGSRIAPSQADASMQAVTYTIQSGDNLYRIALNYGVNLQELASYNNLLLEQTIYPGQVLVIPNQQAEEAQPVRNTSFYGDTLTQEEYEILCAVVQQEAGADNYAGLAAVMSVITNRVDSNWMGAESVYEVITQPSQFEAYGAGHYLKYMGNISESTYQAVNSGLSGHKTTSATSFRSTIYAQANGYTGIDIDGNTFFIE